MVRIALQAAVLTFLLSILSGSFDQARAEKKFEAEKTVHNVHVIVRGATTLDPDVIIEMTGLKQKPDMTSEEIKKRLDTTGLFSYLSVSRYGDFVYIRLRQKLTFFILPYVSKDSIGTYYSATIGKQIVFGEDALVVARYQVGPSDHDGFVMIRDGATLGTPVILEMNFGYEDALHWIYQGSNIVYQYENVYHGGHLEVGYRAYPYFTASITNYVERHRFQDMSLEPFQSGIQWSTLGSLNYDRLYKEDGLSNGFSIKFGFEETNPLSFYQFWRTKLSPTLAVFQNGAFNWVIRGDAAYSPSLPLYQKAELGGTNLRGYGPEEFRGNYYGVIQNDLFLTSTNFWKLNLRTFTFADWGFINSEGRPGVGAGVQIYPKSVAIAAFQVFAGYGLNPYSFNASASLGSGFQ